MEHQSHAFRKDIAGLRALAVIMVIAFHLGSFVPLSEQLQSSSAVTWLSHFFTAGFLGVDVFFVISGFLMTSIIFSRVVESPRPAAAVWEFWKSRARRIVPALIVAIIFFLLIAIQLFDPQRLASFARDIRYALLFVSNFRYARDEGYFEDSALDKLLLHTWSLSVEWQFYLIYPVVLAAAGYFFGKTAAVRLTVFMAAAFTAAAAVLPADSSSYFMFHIRAWELMAGALVYLYPCSLSSTLLRFALYYVGLAAVAASPFIFHEPKVWSITTPAMAVAGSALVIWVNVPSKILDNPVCQYLGNISYSLYIYHWPIMVILAMMLILNPWAALVLIFLLSALSYQLVEKKRGYGWKFAVVFVCLYLISQHVYKSDGWVWRVDRDRYDVSMGMLEVRKPGFSDNYINEWLRTEPEDFSQMKEKHVVVYGDSHADQFTNVLKEHYGDDVGFVISHGALSYASLVSTVEMFSSDREDADRRVNNLKAFMSRLNEMPAHTVIVMNNRWTGAMRTYLEASAEQDFLCSYQGQSCAQVRDNISYTQALYLSLKELVLSHPDITFIVTGSLYEVSPSVTWRDFDAVSSPLTWLYQEYARRFIAPDYLRDKAVMRMDLSKNESVDQVFIQLQQELPNFHYLNIRDSLCSAEGCRIMDDSGVPLFFDDDHLSRAGAAWVGPALIKLIDSQLSSAPSCAADAASAPGGAGAAAGSD